MPVRRLGYVQHTRGVAELAGAASLVFAKLADVEERLSALHPVALVADRAQAISARFQTS